MSLIPSKYAYLIGSLYFLVIWLILFLKWPSLRKHMLIVGIVFLWIGIFAEYFWWTRDWWQPMTITGTRIGIEDFIMSFTHSSIAILIYKYFFKKRLDRSFEISDRIIFSSASRFFPLFTISFFPTAILIHFFHINSFTSTCFGMLLGGVLISTIRPDLLSAQLWSALLMVAVSLPVYILGNFTSPGTISAFWILPGLATQKIIGVPIGDVIWYALLGFFLGGIIEYVFDHRLVDGKN